MTARSRLGFGALGLDLPAGLLLLASGCTGAGDDPPLGSSLDVAADVPAYAEHPVQSAVDAGAPAMDPTPGEARPDPDGLRDADAEVALPDDERCDPVRDWGPKSMAYEERLLELTNQVRAVGADCGDAGVFESSPPLRVEGRLLCAARLHSRYMALTRDYGHVEAQTGLDPFQRIEAVGYEFSAAGENVASGDVGPDEMFAGWLASDFHCANLLRPVLHEIGIACARGWGPGERSDHLVNYCTQDFGTRSHGPEF
ncbi:MAG: CAP domain-containing protein [Myxococcales bacterium]